MYGLPIKSLSKHVTGISGSVKKRIEKVLSSSVIPAFTLSRCSCHDIDIFSGHLADHIHCTLHIILSVLYRSGDESLSVSYGCNNTLLNCDHIFIGRSPYQFRCKRRIILSGKQLSLSRNHIQDLSVQRQDFLLHNPDKTPLLDIPKRSIYPGLSRIDGYHKSIFHDSDFFIER